MPPPSQSDPRDFNRSIDALDDVFAYLDAFCEQAALPESDQFPMRLAVEELFTNMVKYNADGTGPISVRIRLLDDALEVTLIDGDSPPFDITAPRPVDTDAPLRERKIGGLGLHLVNRLMDEIHYDYQEPQTCIRLVRFIA